MLEFKQETFHSRIKKTLTNVWLWEILEKMRRLIAVIL